MLIDDYIFGSDPDTKLVRVQGRNWLELIDIYGPEWAFRQAIDLLIADIEARHAQFAKGDCIGDFESRLNSVLETGRNSNQCRRFFDNLLRHRIETMLPISSTIGDDIDISLLLNTYGLIAPSLNSNPGMLGRIRKILNGGDEPIESRIVEALSKAMSVMTHKAFDGEIVLSEQRRSNMIAMADRVGGMLVTSDAAVVVGQMARELEAQIERPPVRAMRM